MGGGDLNSKKSWHPNTIKNQERVWKAEQAAANEKKRIVELQHERAQERDRAELNELAKQRAGDKDDNRLHWMYDKPDKKGQQEDYLLGRAIDKNYDKPEQEPAIPAVARRVVGSSMLNVGGDTQVDLARKVREDPLILIKERERAARAALLNNPLHRRKITELLKKDQEQQKELKMKKNSKGNDLDTKLAEKLNALGGNKVDLAALLASNDSSESSSEDEKPKKKKKKKDKKNKKSKKKKKEAKSSSESETSDVNKHNEFDIKPLSSKTFRKHNVNSDSDRERGSKKKRYISDDKDEDHNKMYNRKKESTRRDSVDRRDRQRSDSGDRKQKPSGRSRDDRHDRPRETSRDRSERRRGPSPDRQRPRSTRDSNITSKESGRKGLGSEEAAARLEAMAAAGAERERDRALRVARQRDEGDQCDQRDQRGPPRAARPALPDSLEARIHSNRHYIQRDKRHMDTNFARR